MIISSLWRRWHLGHCILSLVSVTEDRLSAVTIMLQQDWGHMSSQGVYGTGKLYLPFPLLFFPFSFPFCCIPPFSSVSSPSFLFLTISHDPLRLLVSWLPDSCSYTQISPAQQKHEVLWLDRFRSPAQPKQITLTMGGICQPGCFSCGGAGGGAAPSEPHGLPKGNWVC